MTDSKNQALRQAVNQIADQLCQTVDGDFDLHIVTDSADKDVQKLSVLCNFMLDSVRRHIGELEVAQENLEAKVDERTERLDLIIQGANDGVWEWDLRHDQVELSKRWFDILGISHQVEALDASYWLDRIHPDDLSGFHQEVRRVVSGISKNISIEYRIRDNAGGYRWVLCRGASAFDEQSRVVRLAGTQTDITEQKFIDTDTGLVNRAYLELVLNERLRHNKAFCLLLISGNSRAVQSQTLSSIETEALNKELISRLMLSSGSPLTMIAALQDNLYACLLDHTGLDQATDRALRIVNRFTEPFNIDDRRIWVSARIGVYDSEETPFHVAEDCIAAARMALHSSLKSELGHVVAYSNTLREQTQKEAEMEQIIRSAILHDWVELHLQPLVSLDTMTITGFEVLCRIRHPDETIGLIPPFHFIPVAEKTGLISDLTQRVIALTIDLFSDTRLVNQFGDAFFLSFNLSARDIYDKNLPLQVFSMMEREQIEPVRLKIEITESAVMSDTDEAVALLQEFRRYGFRIAMDDFGTGYSSLAYLRKLPLDLVKIDRSLVTGVHQDEEKYAILETVVGLCQRLNLEVVVEGIEEQDELAAIQAMHAYLGQGYLLCKPQSVSSLCSVPNPCLEKSGIKPMAASA